MKENLLYLVFGAIVGVILMTMLIFIINISFKTDKIYSFINNIEPCERSN